MDREAECNMKVLSVKEPWHPSDERPKLSLFRQWSNRQHKFNHAEGCCSAGGKAKSRRERVPKKNLGDDGDTRGLGGGMNLNVANEFTDRRG